MTLIPFSSMHCKAGLPTAQLDNGIRAWALALAARPAAAPDR
jgi:hypothetical protein